MTSRSRASSLSRSSRPTTPLRRLSSTSLRAHSLSHSASRAPASAEHPLAHLSTQFSDLANALADLTHNCADLDLVHARLEGVNDSFAAYLWGLRANAYTVDYTETPDQYSFMLAQERAQLATEAHALERQQQQQHDGDETLHSPSRAGHPGAGYGDHAHSETTFFTNDDDSFTVTETPAAAAAARGARGRGGASGIARGRGGAAGARGGRGGAGAGGMTKRRKDEMAVRPPPSLSLSLPSLTRSRADLDLLAGSSQAFADPIMPLLPIALRESRRPECEKVLWALRERPAGTVSASSSSLLVSLPPPRAQR